LERKPGRNARGDFVDPPGPYAQTVVKIWGKVVHFFIPRNGTLFIPIDNWATRPKQTKIQGDKKSKDKIYQEDWSNWKDYFDDIEKDAPTQDTDDDSTQDSGDDDIDGCD
jgi:hypothetical protein